MSILDRLGPLLAPHRDCPCDECPAALVEARALVEQLGAVSPQGIEAVAQVMLGANVFRGAPPTGNVEMLRKEVLAQAEKYVRAYLAGAAEGGTK